MLNLRTALHFMLAGALALVAFVPCANAKKVKPEQVIYDFCSQANCSDGSYSQASLITDGSGNFYGTTTFGGSTASSRCSLGCGVAFKLAPDGTETVLYSFCSQANCTDGWYPAGSLIMDQAGNLYGTTEFGGTGSCTDNSGCGTVFRIAPNGTETTLYSFCSQENCIDGAVPVAGLVLDGAGNLYGTTELGGTSTLCYPGCGTVFEISANGLESVLYSFCSKANCADGNIPEGGLIFDGSGNLYGTTSGGGKSVTCCGTVFELAANRTETVLHSFGIAETHPVAGVTMDASGNLYGTTTFGLNAGQDGTVFKLAPDGTETTLHSFAGGNDGDVPYSGVILDNSGNLYGTTELGGNTSCRKHDGCGTVFKLAPDGTETQLYVFKSQKYGVYPWSSLVSDGKGNLYGTARQGGLTKYGSGVVYKINVDAAAKH